MTIGAHFAGFADHAPEPTPAPKGNRKRRGTCVGPCGRSGIALYMHGKCSKCMRAEQIAAGTYTPRPSPREWPGYRLAAETRRLTGGW